MASVGSNPYSTVFGASPNQLISRDTEKQHIFDTFTSENPSTTLYIITGVRGSGKTVLMTDIEEKFSKMKDWVTVELNIEGSLLESLAAKLNNDKALVKLFMDAHINLSLFGLGVEITNEPPVKDLETAVEKMLLAIKKSGRKVLVLIDEVYKNDEMRSFASLYQILIRKKLPVFLLMTGLYSNIRKLQDDKGLTFLYRAPRLEIQPLGIGRIKRNYKNILGLSDDLAMEAAVLTKGYSYAFQLLGSLLWNEKSEKGLRGIPERVKDQYISYLEEYSYDKIWSELTEKERYILIGLADIPDGKISGLRDKLDMDTNNFNPYRKSLIRKGIVTSTGWGYIQFALPLFREYIIDNWAVQM